MCKKSDDEGTMLQFREGVEDAGILRGPAGPLELGVLDAFAGGGCKRGGRNKFSGADGFGEAGAAGGVVVDGVEEAGEVV